MGTDWLKAPGGLRGGNVSEQNDTMRILIIGDSIAEGLGVQGSSYGDQLRAQLEKAGNEVALLNLSHTGYQISDSYKLLPVAFGFSPNFIIVAHGITEAIKRPKQKAMRFVPPRWRQKGWLDPRPYYSRRLLKRLPQQVESALRWRWKGCLIRSFGGETWTSQPDFSEAVNGLVYAILDHTSAQVILLTQCGLDERFYPGSPASLREYQTIVERIALSYRSTARVHICDVSQKLKKWDDFFVDHFHPNLMGHQKIADSLYDLICKG